MVTAQEQACLVNDLPYPPLAIIVADLATVPSCVCSEPTAPMLPLLCDFITTRWKNQYTR